MSAVWFEVTLEVPGECSEAVANFLIEQGSPGLQVQERDDKVCLVAYFSEAPPREALRRFCTDLGCPVDGGAIRTRQIAEEDWAQNWKLHFRPQLIGDRLCVCPPWEVATPADRVAVVIDPGMAFGTGHHASTRGCLSLLDWATRTQCIRRGLDVGTGSGVLAIAMAKLQVTEVWAVDTDPHALATAKVNAARNSVEQQIDFALALNDVPGSFDLVTANLYANLLQELAGEFTRLTGPGGMLICSGLLVDDEYRVRRTYQRFGFGISRHYEEDGWVTLALRGQAQP